MDSNFNAINERIAYAEHMLKFYEGFNQNSAYAKYWKEYKSYLENFKKTGESKSISKDSRFNENNYVRDAAKWIKDNYRIDAFYGDGYTTMMESKKERRLVKEDNIQVGDYVEIVDGKFAGDIGQVMKIDTVNKLYNVTVNDFIDHVVVNFNSVVRLESKKQSKGRLHQESDTFKCPDCGGKVLTNTKYCMSCKKKVKEESVIVRKESSAYDYIAYIVELLDGTYGIIHGVNTDGTLEMETIKNIGGINKFTYDKINITPNQIKRKLNWNETKSLNIQD
jgi:uncharacterized OB-fold protein